MSPTTGRGRIDTQDGSAICHLPNSSTRQHSDRRLIYLSRKGLTFSQACSEQMKTVWAGFTLE